LPALVAGFFTRVAANKKTHRRTKSSVGVVFNAAARDKSLRQGSWDIILAETPFPADFDRQFVEDCISPSRIPLACTLK
jgi:hypothetical protein